MSYTRALIGVLAATLVAALLATQIASAGERSARQVAATGTATPIKHLVVIFQENVSFDHYFGTYPSAANTDGQPFVGVPGTPKVDGLVAATASSIPASLRHGTDLTTTNPNTSLPIRLDTSPTGPGGNGNGEITCDQDHDYSDEQQAFDGGAMDQFVQSVGTDGNSHAPGNGSSSGGALCDPKTVMDYYDGNAVTGLWNYAQRYAMSDNSYGTTFGPSAPGAINLASGNTGGVDTGHESDGATHTSPVTIDSATVHDGDIEADGNGGFSLTSDAQPYWDDCTTRDAVALTGTNIGNELNTAGISWGWFQGGFRPTTPFATAAAAPEIGHAGQPTATFIPDEFSGSFTGKVVPTGASNQALCDSDHPVGVAFGATVSTHAYGFKDDYIAHHEPFQYYASTANPHHLTIVTDAGGSDLVSGPDSLSSIGTDTQSFVAGVPQFDTPNHQYDTSDFDQLVAAITAGKLPPSALPAVSFLKAPGYQDGHAAYSDPADEQEFLVKEINSLMRSPDWSSTAIVVNYDDSDGWYDHASSGVVNPSLSPADNLTNTVLGTISSTNAKSQQCGSKPQTTAPLGGEQGRCGFGPRLPMLMISPCARQNAVDHNLTDQTSIINFVEYNWHLPSIPGSFDHVLAATDKKEHAAFDLAGMFDFAKCSNPSVILDQDTGRVDLRNAKLGGKNMQSADLSGAELTGAALNGANLNAAFLPYADLDGANLAGANLNQADLAHADLENADLRAANLNGADLAGADLSGANAAAANTNAATWLHTICPDGSNSDADGGSCKGHL